MLGFSWRISSNFLKFFSSKIFRTSEKNEEEIEQNSNFFTREFFFQQKLNLDISGTKNQWNLKFCKQNDKIISELIMKKFWILNKSILLSVESIYFRGGKKIFTRKKMKRNILKTKNPLNLKFRTKNGKIISQLMGKSLKIWLKNFFWASNQFFP